MRCHWPIASLPGVDEKLQQDLAALGITDTQRLLKVSAAKHVALAAELEQPLRQLKKIMALASLAQVPAVGCEYCGLLLHGGIASIEQLSSTRPQLIHRSILRLHVGLLQRRDLTPTVDRVQLWVEQAKQILQN
jgi:Domain of unknown function (DUF4332)